MSFDVAKWNKKRYLAEAGILQEDEIDTLHDLIYNANPLYHNLAKALAKFLKGTEEDLDSGFSKDQIKDFIKILHAELGIKESLSEGAYDIEDITPENIDKVDISFVEGSTRLYAVYIYLKGGNGRNWDKKLSSSEFQKVLDMLGIDFDFKSDPYYYGDATVKALEDKGYTATTSDFDVS